MNKMYYILLGMIIATLAMLTDEYMNKPDRVIDLPEEWKEAKQGDTLKIYRITKDSIYIGFYNQNNS